jgi:type II secretory pathway pseudopilin PulG
VKFGGLRGARAFTLVEAIVVCLVAATVLGSLITFMVTSSSWTTRGTDQALAANELRIALSRISREIRESRQVLYPSAGRKAQSALGFTSPKGEAVFFRLVAGKDPVPAAPYDLVREPVGGKPEVILARVTRLSFGVSDPGRGREPSLVRVLVTRATGADPKGDSGVSMLTSAAARAVMTRCLALRGEEP